MTDEVVQVVREVRERVVARECECCGNRFDVEALGRLPKYCGSACRQRAWELRRALATLERGDPRPQVVREVVERIEVEHRTKIVRQSTGLRMPGTGREWAELLATLTAKLGDPDSPVVTRHYDHRRLYDALLTAAQAVEQVTPGGARSLNAHR